MFLVASSLEGEYEHWKASNNPSEGLLFDQKSKRSVGISGQFMTFSTKDDALFKEPFEQLSELIMLFLGQGDISEIARVSLRRSGLHTVNKTYDEFNDKFFETFYGSQKELKDILADKIDDVALTLNGIKDGFHNRNRYGPVKQDEIERWYGLEEYESSSDLTLNGKTGVLVDTEIYSLEEADIDDTLRNIKEIVTVSAQMYNDSWELIKSHV